jgi:hypothetical protein
MSIETQPDNADVLATASKEKTPVQLMAAVMAEMHSSDSQRAKVLQTRVVCNEVQRGKTEEAERRGRRGDGSARTELEPRRSW